MTEMGRRVGTGDMLKSVYDSNEDGVIAVAQTEADMTKAAYDTVINALISLAAAHKTQHQSGGADALDVTGLTGTTPYALLGGSFVGRVLRQIYLYVSDGTAVGTIKVKANSLFNGDGITEVDNLEKSETDGPWTLEADGQKLVIDASAFSGNIQMCMINIARTTAQEPPLIYAEKYGNHIRLHFYDFNTATGQDITADIGTGEIRAVVTYVTDA